MKLTTVGELMIQLAQQPMDMPVLVDGYEGGYDRFRLEVVRVGPADRQNEPWFGEFDERVYTGEPFEVLAIRREGP